MRRMLVAGLFLSVFTANAFAQKSITVTGCVQQGVEAKCLILRTFAGKTYNVTAAKPTPTPGTYGTVKGTLKSDGVDTCQQGPIIDPASWSMRGKFCPKARRPK